MSAERHTAEEACRLGDQIYAARIKERVERDHVGEYAVIDVDTGDYEVGPAYPEIMDLMLDRRPDASLYIMRIGSSVLGRIGGRLKVAVP